MQVYSLISGLKIYQPTLRFTLWSLDLFVRVGHHFNSTEIIQFCSEEPFCLLLCNQSRNFQCNRRLYSCSGEWCAQAIYCMHHKIKESVTIFFSRLYWIGPMFAFTPRFLLSHVIFLWACSFMHYAKNLKLIYVSAIRHLSNITPNHKAGSGYNIIRPQHVRSIVMVTSC